MSENTFKTTNTGKEYPARFAGMEFTYTAPVAVEGNVEQTLDNLRAVCDPAADFASILAGKFNGQGYHLDWQKELKGFLGRTTKDDNGAETSVHADRTPEEVRALAEEHMRTFRIGTPRPKGEGKQSKVAKLEAERDELRSEALDMYRSMNRSQRAKFRAGLIEKGRATAAELDAIEAE
jgi:hypothetical protein